VNLVWAVLILLLANVAAIGVMLFIRRGAPEGGYFADSDRASGVFGVLAGGFAIFGGFVIFLAFTSYDQSRTGSETEALTVLQQYETAQFLPAAVQGRLGGELVCYARYVVDTEWPRMENGTTGDTINPWSVALFHTLRLAEPASNAEQSAYDKWLDQTSAREEGRLDRIHGAVGIIPTSVWIVLFLVAAVVFTFVLFYADSGERARSQAMLVGSVTTVLLATLLVLRSLDNPYRSGVGSIEPVAMERTLTLLEQARSAVNDSTRPPCDAAGTATS